LLLAASDTIPPPSSGRSSGMKQGSMSPWPGCSRGSASGGSGGTAT